MGFNKKPAHHGLGAASSQQRKTIMTASTSITLRAASLKTVQNYSQAAERAVGAYRFGGQRLISALRRSVDRVAAQGVERLAPRLATALRRANDQVTGLASKSLDAVSRRTEHAIASSGRRVNAQLDRVADLAAGADNRVVVSGVQAIARLGLPGARVALALSERVAAGAGKLPGAPVVAPVVAEVKPVKPAKPAKRTASTRSPAPAQAEAPVKVVARRSAAGAKRASQATAAVGLEAVAEVAPKAARKARARASQKGAGLKAAARRASQGEAEPQSLAAAPAMEAVSA
jgi:hypothetical protein